MASLGASAAASTRLVATSGCRVRRPRSLGSPRVARNTVVPASLGDSIALPCKPAIIAHRSLSTKSMKPASSYLAEKVALGKPASGTGWTKSTGVRPEAFSTLASTSVFQQQEEISSVKHIAALVACALSFVAATATTTAGGPDPLITNTSTKYHPRNGGNGGGPSRKYPPASGVVSKEDAEEDVKVLEKECLVEPYMVSQQAFQGARWTMEDTYSVENGGRFVAVFDGHGGSAVSTTLRDRLYGIYSEELRRTHQEEQNDFGVKREKIPAPSSHVIALERALEQVEEIVIQDDELEYQGSTAVCIVTHVARNGKRTLLSANVGDSRAILSRKGKAVDLTRDHKPNDELERERITAMGEEIEWDTYGQVYRVRDLSLSRAIGDRFAKPVVTSEPEIMSFPVREDEDEFVLLASDGLWDVMSSQEVVDFVHENLKFHPELTSAEEKQKYMATIVANEALERGSADNVCILLVWLDNDS